MEATVQTKKLARLWRMPLITGLISIGLGVWTLLDPSQSIPIFAYTFAAIMVFAGISQFVSSGMMYRMGASWGWSIVIGILDLVAGIWMFTLPEGALTTTFIYIIAIWILVVAINAIIEACAMASHSPLALIFMILLLVATVVFAVIFLANPIVSGITAWLWLGLSLITFGVYRMILANRIKNMKTIRFRV
ncbi:MAG: DUF308 domain-containing protein [Muribaculaceae bacterium]|nr:DUF308 domain-containing protein [Muribaculaceae bacterium]MDE6009078.1 DUF308 domain-containing protein [Muribaculaceae bacterium]MDE6793662.1 DUF308 domain-containing protein [Muribaculaceae bacterium]